MSRRFIMLVVAALALALVPAGAAVGQGKGKSKAKAQGATSLVVDSAALAALTERGIAPAAVRPGKLSGATFSFPITTNYRVAGRTAKISHTGGIRLTRNGTSVVLRNFIIDAAKKQLTARVGNARVAILDLGIPDGFKLARTSGPVDANLTAGAAQALNAAFGLEGAQAIPAGL